MTLQYVQFSDETHTKIISWFASGDNDPEVWPNQGTVEEDDPRWLDYINPPPDLLAINSAKLQSLTRLANDQKTALTARIGTINDAIELEMQTPEEEAELIVRTAQLKQWKTYAVLLGRVTAQSGWFTTIVWPAQPAGGMDLTVSARAPQSV